jgi:hypothetical protein
MSSNYNQMVNFSYSLSVLMRASFCMTARGRPKHPKLTRFVHSPLAKSPGKSQMDIVLDKPGITTFAWSEFWEWYAPCPRMAADLPTQVQGSLTVSLETGQIKTAIQFRGQIFGRGM